MLNVNVEVSSPRTVKTKNGEKFVHQFTLKTEEGYQCFEEWKDSPLTPGVYKCSLIPRAYNNRLGLSVSAMEQVK